MDKLFCFDETGKTATWKEVKGSKDFTDHIIEECGLKRGDHMIIINDSSVEASTDRFSVILKAWKDQKNDPGAIQLIKLLNYQASTYLSISPMAGEEANEG